MQEAKALDQGRFCLQYSTSVKNNNIALDLKTLSIFLMYTPPDKVLPVNRSILKDTASSYHHHLFHHHRASEIHELNSSKRHGHHICQDYSSPSPIRLVCHSRCKKVLKHHLHIASYLIYQEET